MQSSAKNEAELKWLIQLKQLIKLQQTILKLD